MHPDDSELVQTAREGDTEAFAGLLARHRPLLLELCRRALGDAALAEDAAQEATLRAMLSLHALRDAAQFGSWLAGIGLNVCRLWLRQRSREGRSWEAVGAGSQLRLLSEEPPDPQALAESADLAAAVRRAVAELPRGQRGAVLLHYLSGLSYAETAALLGIEVGAVRTRLHKARGTLRWQLSIVWEKGSTPMSDSTTKPQYTCSFCRKKNAEVKRMIAGPGKVYICNECVDLCNKIIAEEEAKAAG